jgi:DNA (cytosine-5)-methyltransferase 1
MLTVGSLFAGIGGFDLGLESAGMRVIWQSEIDPYASAVLKKHWPHVPNHGDVRAIDPSRIERPDLLCGGFPCQDTSIAGRGRGIEGEHSGLWAEMSRLVRAFRPRYVLMENSVQLLNRGIDAVIGDLASIGYDAEWDCVPAAALRAPHLRAREWILAYPAGERDGEQETTIFAGRLALEPCDWWKAEPDLERVADGIPDQSHRLRCLGNAIVPQIAEIIGRAILSAEAA